MDNQQPVGENPQLAGASSKGNPFSIDYILSTSVAAAAAAACGNPRSQPESQKVVPNRMNFNFNLNLLNQQQPNNMANQLLPIVANSSAANSSAITTLSQQSIDQNQFHQRLMAAAQLTDQNLTHHQRAIAVPETTERGLMHQQAMAAALQLKIGQQSSPNFIYLLTCMLIQQQQQQQIRQQHLQQLQQQHHVQHVSHPKVACPRQLDRQPMDLARGTQNFTFNKSGDKIDSLKPAHSYIGLIAMCILSSPEKRMVLNDIYQFILDHYPYYKNRGSGWRNSVRHNLSLNECFQKSGRAANGKGHYWTIHPANMSDFMMGDFRRRRAQRKVRRWNNLDVPSDESEDESIDDATKPPLPEHFKRSLEMHRRLELNYQSSVSQAAVGGQIRPPSTAMIAQSMSSTAVAGCSNIPLAPRLTQPGSSSPSPVFHDHNLG